MRPRIPKWHVQGEPIHSLYTPEWMEGGRRVERMREPKRSHYRAFFAHLDSGWRIIRPLQFATEAILYDVNPEDDAARFVDLEVSDNYRWLALACLQMINGYRILPELGDRAPFGTEPPLDDLGPEAEAIARNVRLLAMMEGSEHFPEPFRGQAGAAAEQFTEWQSGLMEVAEPVIRHVVRKPRKASKRT